MICQKSDQWAYLATKDKSGKFPESVSSSGVYSCVDTLKIQKCNEERRKYFRKMGFTNDRFYDLMETNNGDMIYRNCLSDLRR